MVKVEARPASWQYEVFRIQVRPSGLVNLEGRCCEASLFRIQLLGFCDVIEKVALRLHYSSLESFRG